MGQGFFFPTHWLAIASDAKAQGHVGDDGSFSTGVFGPVAIADLEARDRYLEDFLNNLSSGQGGAVFSWPGPVNSTIATGGFNYFVAGNTSKLWLSCGQQASTTTTIQLYKNGSTWGGSFTFAATTSTAQVTFAQSFAAGDLIQAAIPTIGTNLADFVLQIQ